MVGSGLWPLRWLWAFEFDGLLVSGVQGGGGSALGGGGDPPSFWARGMEKANKVRLRERDRELGEPSGP